MGSGPEVTEKLHHIKVVSSTLRHERDSNSELSWWQTLIAQKVVNPPTIRSRARPEVTEILHHITIVSSTLRHKRDSNSELSLMADVDCTESCKSNYHTITSTTNPTNKD